MIDMPVFDLGTLTIVDHEADSLIDAFGIPSSRLDAIIELCYESWKHEDTISESVEYLAQRLHSSELVLALVTFGRIWEENENDTSTGDESSEPSEEKEPGLGL